MAAFFGGETRTLPAFYCPIVPILDCHNFLQEVAPMKDRIIAVNGEQSVPESQAHRT